jgi:ribonuclease VapC
VVADSSAIVAIILGEPDAPRLVRELGDATRVLVSAATYLEASIVMARRLDVHGLQEVDRLLTRFDIAVEPVTEEQARIARDAFLRFGKGRHPAALNFGDCFSYSLAKHQDEALLFVGSDFSDTDVRSATA